jgi:8-oxo-dGTP pyrophosphatase MutT (NUDIX family)
MKFSTLSQRLSLRRPERLEHPEALRAAVALILCPAGDGLELLFIRRAQHPKDPWSGQIGLPGGHQELSDSDLLATALRETTEELGHSMTRECLVAELDDLHPQNAHLPSIIIRPFVFGLDHRPTVTASSEVAGYFWISLTALKTAESRAEVVIGGKKKTVNAYCVEDGTIWGITRRIVRPMLETALESRQGRNLGH